MPPISLSLYLQYVLHIVCSSSVYQISSSSMNSTEVTNQLLAHYHLHFIFIDSCCFTGILLNLPSSYYVGVFHFVQLLDKSFTCYSDKHSSFPIKVWIFVSNLCCTLQCWVQYQTFMVLTRSFFVSYHKHLLTLQKKKNLVLNFVNNSHNYVNIVLYTLLSICCTKYWHKPSF